MRYKEFRSICLECCLIIKNHINKIVNEGIYFYWCWFGGVFVGFLFMLIEMKGGIK